MAEAEARWSHRAARYEPSGQWATGRKNQQRKEMMCAATGVARRARMIHLDA